jgi:hypothetical protein
LHVNNVTHFTFGCKITTMFESDNMQMHIIMTWYAYIP